MGVRFRLSNRMLARHIPKVLAPQRCLSLGVRRMVEGGISESSSEHFHASGQGMDANIAGSTMEDFLAARNETDRVAKIKDFANWYDQQMAELEAATEAIKADPRHGSLTFSVVGGGDKESWITQSASEARYYASNLWGKQMIRYQELNVSHTSRLETCPVLGTRLLFICICQGLWLLFVGGNGASSCANPPGVPEF